MSGGVEGRLTWPFGRRSLAVLVVLSVFCGAGVGVLQSGDSGANVASDVAATVTPSGASGVDASGRETSTPAAGSNSLGDASTATEGDGGGGDAVDRNAPSTPSASRDEGSTGNSVAGTERTAGRSDRGADDNDDSGGERAPVDLAVGRAAAESLRFDGVVPGSDGAVRLSAHNEGRETGDLSVRVADVVDRENGLLEPERDAGDDGAEGELSSAVAVRISVGDDYLVGDDDTWVPLSALEAADVGTATLRPGETRALDIEWRVDPVAGNEIQSDTTTVNVRVVLSQR
ncbi:hypothetical protein [Halogeometricum luteum]|uniref:Uncharacterized protein n=1 Tax=Halogeometricum luteum TaxID=2950537 RepID=A0ABU2FWA1_9EURY|nr:hypothetical protein [Halogeometricum sp. S3BR5-2]MDS0292807.1 hypothetical protein [Halogeometricum sp. S3BR5-2]